MNDFKQKSIRNIWLVIVLLFTIGLVCPIILQYVYGWKAFADTAFSISVYGIYLFTYMIIQFIFAWFNKWRWNARTIENVITRKQVEIKNPDFSSNLNNTNESKSNVLVVGYRENETYYKMCLESLKTLYTNTWSINKIYVIIDGDEPEDHYMVDMFCETFPDNSVCIRLPESRTPDSVIVTDYIQQVEQPTFICITQKHSGKRAAMYTGFQFSLLENTCFNRAITTVFCTDSDTVVDPDCLNQMQPLFDNKHVGAVCGDLHIHNKYDSTIAFLSSIRYWFAFNLERAYQSFSGSVLCISGPIGMYRISSLERVIETWSTQQFLGKQCTYGDDRHLTNRILDLPQNTVYTPLARADTETPATFYRFYKQQIRWNKSSFREIFWNVQFVHKQSLFMTVDLIYVVVYPFVVMGYLSYVMWCKTVIELSVYCGIMFTLNLIKSIYGFVVSKRPENLLYALYGFIYITSVFPAKLWALVTINDNSWGTSTRKILQNDVSLDIVSLVIWNSNLLAGIAINLYRSITLQLPIYSYLFIICIFGTNMFLYIYVTFYINNKRDKHDKYR